LKQTLWAKIWVTNHKRIRDSGHKQWTQS